MDGEFQNSTYIHDDVQNIESFIYIVGGCNESRLLGSFDFFRSQLGRGKESTDSALTSEEIPIEESFSLHNYFRSPRKK